MSQRVNKGLSITRQWLLGLLLCLFGMAPVAAAPGDILFSDDFESGSLATVPGKWTVDNSGGGDAGVFNDTSVTGSLSMYTRWDQVIVTSQVVDTNVPAAELDIRVVRGDDDLQPYSEDTDNGEDFVIEYLDNGSNWVAFETFLGSGTNGQSYTRTYTLPAAALHSGFRLRVRQTNGSGGSGNGGIGYDYWHVDDLVLTEVTYVPPSTSGFCDGFESGTLSPNWSVTAGPVSRRYRHGTRHRGQPGPVHALGRGHGDLARRRHDRLEWRRLAHCDPRCRCAWQ